MTLRRTFGRQSFSVALLAHQLVLPVAGGAFGAETVPNVVPAPPAPSAPKTGSAKDLNPPSMTMAEMLQKNRKRRDELVDQAFPGPPIDGMNAMRPAKKVLLDTLGRKATPRQINCRKAGCYVDVDYKNIVEFIDFDKGRIHSGTSPLNNWTGMSGHSGLFKRGKRLMATWYALDKEAPESLKEKQP